MKLAQITLLDGPCQGRSVRYGHPLPLVLVVASRDPIRWHDYIQTTRTDVYRHSPRCKCVAWEQTPVDLDAIVRRG